MDIKEFVTATLTQIAEGAAEANKSVRAAGGVVNPAMSVLSRSDSYMGSYQDGGHVYAVDFDVAVTVTAATGVDGGAKLQVASIMSMGIGAKSSDVNQSTSRVQFRIPLGLPIDEKTLEDLRAEHKRQDEAVRQSQYRPNY